MKYLKIIALILGLFFLTCDAKAEQQDNTAAPAPAPRILTIEDSGSEIQLGLGETINLELKEAVDGGYLWHTDELDESHIKLVSKGGINSGELYATPQLYASPQVYKKGIPVGGYFFRIWSIKGIAPGDTVLRLLHYRSWKGKESAIDEFEVKLHISGTNGKSNAITEPADEIQKEFSGAKGRGGYLNVYDNGRDIQVGSDAIIMVDLKVLDETGADWYTDELDQSRLKYIGEKSVVISPKMIAGGSVFKTLYFKTIAPGDATLKLLYYQASEGKETASNKFEIKLHIADK